VTPLEAARDACHEDEVERVVKLVERAIREDRERRLPGGMAGADDFTEAQLEDVDVEDIMGDTGEAFAKVVRARDADWFARLSAVDEGAMRVALAGGCCARHVALGRCVGGGCDSLTRNDIATLASVAMDVRRSDVGREGLADALLVLCATLAGRTLP